MRFGYPYLLLLLILIIPLIWLLTRLGRQRRKRFGNFAEAQFYPHYLGALSPFYTSLRLALLIAAYAFTVLALARPQWDYSPQTMESSGIDLICCIDVSKSMDATDMLPTRLSRAQLQISAFTGELNGDRVGIIAFAGQPSLECPLTDDYDAVQMVISSLSTDTVGMPGTDLGAALDLAGRAFDSGSGKKVLIVISDGEDLEAKAVKRAVNLKDMGVTIYTMGVGSEQGALIQNPDTGEEVLTKLDAKTLARVAEAGGGKYFSVTPSQNEIRILLDQIFGMERSKLRSREINAMKDQFHVFLLIAFGLFGLALFISPWRKGVRR